MTCNKLEITSIKSIENPQARDLAWTLLQDSDLLLSCPPFYRYEPATDLEWLQSLAQNPQPLLDYLTARSGHCKLGIYFEYLVDYYLRFCPSSTATNISRNLRMGSTEGQIPFGELDFVFEQESQVGHLEVAVKFYLGIEDASGGNWVGPNPSDSWSRKIGHMHMHQLPLGDHLAKLIKKPIKNYYWVKGRLFQPWKGYLQPPAGVTASTTDSWIHYGSVHNWVNNTPERWTILPRARWLGGLSAGELQANAVRGKLLMDAISNCQKQNDFSLMLESVPAAGRSFYMMIVPDGWPYR